ncbi:hypothetical protein [Mucilaginibacter sp. SP1R1]|uniref:hypothetical protein n=1 Tax=Mucilaginibacter sp. SP1R1 TaxID=2723091 RepID=UPI00160769A9|nr:hypothetical protein [Mucilaginibacter sp. SP1R1]MBB6147467.1 hypothetical protein [Mucilaginibacter sp. SP1R1]
MKKILLLLTLVLSAVHLQAQINKPLPKYYLASHIVTIREAFNDGRENNNVEIEIAFIPPKIKDNTKGSIKLHYNGTNHDDYFTLTYNKTTKDKNSITHWYYTNDNTYPELQIRYMFPPMTVQGDENTYSYIVIFSGNYTNSQLQHKTCYISNELIKN